METTAHKHPNYILIWVYLAAIALVSGITYARMPETKGQPLR